MHQIRRNARPTSVRRAALVDQRETSALVDRAARSTIAIVHRAARPRGAIVGQAAQPSIAPLVGTIVPLSLWSGLSLSLSLSLSFSGSELKWKWRQKWISVVKGEICGQPEIIFRKIISEITLKSIQTQPKADSGVWGNPFALWASGFGFSR